MLLLLLLRCVYLFASCFEWLVFLFLLRSKMKVDEGCSDVSHKPKRGGGEGGGVGGGGGMNVRILFGIPSGDS